MANESRLPMLYRYCTIFFLLLYFVAPVAAEMAITRIVEVKRGSGFTVFLEAGTNHGLVQGTKVTLLREGEKIVHPLSGQVLGVPQEPVGMAEVRSAEANRAVAVLIKTYSTPKVGDMAEYDKASAKAVAQVAKEPEVVAHVMERVRGLEKDIKSYRKSQKTLSAYPVFAQQVWDEMGAIKSYLVTIDERLIELEAQQGEDRNRLSQVLNGEYMAQEAKELTIRYSEDTDVRLQVAGKTLVISVERDSLHLERAGVGTMKPVIDLDPPVVESEEDDDSGWSMGVESDILGSPYIFGGGLALIAALTGIAMFVIKRRYDDVMGGLEEFDELPDGEDFDSEDFDDDDDFDDEEYKA
jgi:hypothetical protein